MASTAFAQMDDLISSAQLSVIKISANRIMEAQATDYKKFKESDSSFMDKIGAWWLNWKIDSKTQSISSYIEKVKDQKISTDRMEALHIDHKQLVKMRENYVTKYGKGFFKMVY